jgi:hypothetical protein
VSHRDEQDMSLFLKSPGAFCRWRRFAFACARFHRLPSPPAAFGRRSSSAPAERPHPAESATIARVLR